MSEEEGRVDQTKKKSVPAGKPDRLDALLSRFEGTLERIEAGTMDESERKQRDASRRIEELEQDRDRQSTKAKEWERRFKESFVRQLLLDAATAGGAYRADQVVSLLSGRVSLNEDGSEPFLTLPTREGKAAVYQPDRFVDGVKAFLEENPNLAAGTGGGGAGSRTEPEIVTTGGTKTLAELRRLKAQLEAKARGMR